MSVVVCMTQSSISSTLNMSSSNNNIVDQIDQLNESIGQSIERVDRIIRSLFGGDSDDESEILVEHEHDDREIEEEEDEMEYYYDDSDDQADAGHDDDDDSFVIPGPGSPAPPRALRFDDQVYMINSRGDHVVYDPDFYNPHANVRLSFDSDGTVRQNFTPFWYPARRDAMGDCSDSETVVDEWEEPVTPSSGRHWFEDDDDATVDINDVADDEVIINTGI